MKELKVNAIKNGTVIDHIPSESVFKIVKILNLDTLSNEILLGTNLVSKKGGKKGIIKISDLFLSESEINKIAILGGNVTLNIIRDYNVIEKSKLDIPDKVCSIVKCFNPNCITNYEKVSTKFSVISKKDLKLKCNFCGKITQKENLEIL